MGGHVFVGIRKRNGTIYRAERWTNPTSWWFNNPAFYDADEKVLDEYINLQEKPQPQTEIHPSEYGVILYDAFNGKLLSRQDYCGIGHMMVDLYDEEKMELTLEHRKRGHITGLHVYPTNYDVDIDAWETSFWGPKPAKPGPIVADKEKLSYFFEIVEGALKAEAEGNRRFAMDLPENQKSMFDIIWEIEGIEVDDLAGERGYYHWPKVVQWVSDQGWACPIWSQEKVTEMYITRPSDAV